MSKICKYCKYHEYEDIDKGYVCVNADSDKCSDWTAMDDTCRHFTERTYEEWLSMISRMTDMSEESIDTMYKDKLAVFGSKLTAMQRTEEFAELYSNGVKK